MHQEKCKICNIKSSLNVYAKALKGYICSECNELTQRELMGLLIQRIEEIEIFLTTGEVEDGKS